jgi:hypothetical protein
MPRPPVLLAVLSLGVAACHDAASTAPEPPADIAPPVFCCGWGPSAYSAATLALPAGAWTASRATAINDSNRVVGYVTISGAMHRPVRWVGGLPTLMVVSSSNHYAIPWAVNNGGDAVGQQQWISGNQSTQLQPVRWLNPGTIGVLSTLGFDGVARDINTARITVGYSRATSSGKDRAVKWSAGGTITSIHPAFAEESRAESINDAGEILGTVRIAGVRHAWKWLPNNATIDLGVAGAARSINAIGEAVGTATVNGMSQAVQWGPNGVSFALGAGSFSGANAISDGRRVVGATGPSPWTRLTAAVLSLPFPGSATYAAPAGINRCGRIVGHAGGGSYTSEVPVQWTAPGCDP